MTAELEIAPERPIEWPKSRKFSVHGLTRSASCFAFHAESNTILDNLVLSLITGGAPVLCRLEERKQIIRLNILGKEMDWTGEQVRTARAKLQTHVEALVGKALFAYSQLESALDLCLVWVAEGRSFELRTSNIHRMRLFDKLELLASDVALQTSDRVEVKAAYAGWLARSHTVREHRNVLVHGRLGVDVQRGMLVVVKSRPTSSLYDSVEYRATELEQIISEIELLTNELSEMRVRFPL